MFNPDGSKIKTEFKIIHIGTLLYKEQKCHFMWRLYEYDSLGP